ncbi:hypothetical protein J2T02_004117 [Chitinophaga terrae (ex Kim and Jung 2007)]|nr:hypothetical protein [Chitinophaga terrae (ex Kim and Jung 2007)]
MGVKWTMLGGRMDKCGKAKPYQLFLFIIF